MKILIQKLALEAFLHINTDKYISVVILLKVKIVRSFLNDLQIRIGHKTQTINFFDKV